MGFNRWQRGMVWDDIMGQPLNQVFRTLHSLQGGNCVSQVEALAGIEWSETPDRVIIFFQLPGVNPEAVQVEVLSDSVVLTGEQRRLIQSLGILPGRGFCYSRFRRVVPLPCAVDGDQIWMDTEAEGLWLTLYKQGSKKMGRDRLIKRLQLWLQRFNWRVWRRCGLPRAWAARSIPR